MKTRLLVLVLALFSFVTPVLADRGAVESDTDWYGLFVLLGLLLVALLAAFLVYCLLVAIGVIKLPPPPSEDRR